jgi:hypothetical protein
MLLTAGLVMNEFIRFDCLLPGSEFGRMEHQTVWSENKPVNHSLPSNFCRPKKERDRWKIASAMPFVSIARETTWREEKLKFKRNSTFFREWRL